MGEGQTVRPKGNFAIVLQCAVLPLPYQGQTPGGKLHPDLVGTTGFQGDLDKAFIYVLFQYPVAQGRRLDTFSRLGGYHGHFPCLIPQEQVAESAGICFRCAMDYRLIFFLEGIFPDLP